MKIKKAGPILLLLIVVFSQAGAQKRKNLNNWYIGANIGTTITHMDIRPRGFDAYMQNPFHYFSYSFAPEISYHFTHGLGVIMVGNIANVRGDEVGKSHTPLREFDTDLRELKFLAHINFGQALSFNKRRNMVNPYINVGVGPSWGTLNLPTNMATNQEYANWLLYEDGFLETPDEVPAGTKFNTWNKNFQAGFFFYGNRYFDFDIRYNYTFFNEDYIDGSAIDKFINREWDKYSTISVGGKFKFGANNKRTYEHTSWARPLIEEDTSLFNNLVLMEEYDDGTGNTVFKMRSGDQYNEEQLTRIDNKSDDNEMYQAVYNAVMNNPDLRDSLMKAIMKDLTQNDAFIVNISDNVCENCKPQYVEGTRTVIREVDKGENGEDGYSSESERRRRQREGEDGYSSESGRRNNGVGNANKKVTPPQGYTGPTEFQLENIYYDLDKYYIREDAAKTLDELTAILKKYPSLKIELGSHTDCRNTMKYNLWLSQKRADAAVNYLICKGIDRCRLVATGYGESRLINGCGCEGDVEDKTCSEAEHQANRRTMVTILDYNYQKGDDCQTQSKVDADASADAAANSAEKTVKGGGETPFIASDENLAAAGVSKTSEAGYYVVAGTSYRPDYANIFVEEIKGEGYDGAGIFYKNDKTYFVYLKRYDNYEEAQKEVRNMRCCGKYPDAWIHVHNK